MFLDHMVVNKKSEIVHYGIHGIRDWEKGKVQFKTRDNKDVEWEEIGEKKTDKGIIITHTKKSKKK